MDTPYSVIMTDYIIRSIGMSFIMMPIMTAGMNALPMKLISHGTATQNTSRQVAGSIGTAILITLMTQQTTAHVADYGNMLTTSNPILVDKVHGMGQSLAYFSWISSSRRRDEHTTIIWTNFKAICN